MKRRIIAAIMVFIAVPLAAQVEHTGAPDSSALLALSAARPDVPAQDTTRKPPADFIDVDTPPSVIHRVEPKYPEVAKRAGMEGKVWLKIWIDTSGTAREVVVLKSDADVFNAPAIEAARGFRFTPAYNKNRPVDVWVSVPFKFVLAEKADTTGSPGSRQSPSEEKFFDAIRALLQGGKLPPDFVTECIAPHATVIAGGTIRPLRDVAGEQNAGKHSLEDAGRKAVVTPGQAIDGSGVGYVVIRTDAAGKQARPHYHTIVFLRSADGNPRIIHWQASR